MGKPTFNLTGDWSGEFMYPLHSGPTTPFLATIVDDAGRVAGSIIEPDTVSGGPTVTAVLSGHRSGSSVDFTKRYLCPPYGYENPVDYVGSLSEDGNTVTGVWSLLEADGTFEMRREATAGDLVEEDAAVALPEPTFIGDRPTLATPELSAGPNSALLPD